MAQITQAQTIDMTGVTSGKFNSEKWWQQAIPHALRVRKQESSETRWRDIDDYWNHKGEEFEPGEPSFNAVYMYGSALLPKIIFRAPTIINTPTRLTPGGMTYAQRLPYAAALDGIDTMLMQETEAVDVFQDAALYAYLYNFAPVEAGYDFPELPDIRTEDFFRQAHAARSNFDQPEGQVDRARRNNFVWFDLIHPSQLVLDPFCGRNPRKMRWYAKALYVPTRVLKDDKSLKRGATDPSHIPAELADSYFARLIESEGVVEPYSLVWEVHEAETRTFCWLNSSYKYLFKPEPDPMQLDGLPLEILRFNRSPNSMWGTPDPLYIEPQMFDGNETRRLALYQKRQALLKFIVNGDIISDEEIDKVVSEGITAIRATNLPAGITNVKEAIAMLQPHVQSEFGNYKEDLINDMDRIIGSAAFSRGAQGGGRKTKFEVAKISEGVSEREQGRQAAMANLIGRCFRKANQAVIKYWGQPILERLMGVDGAQYFVQFSPTDIKGEMSTTADVSSMLPRSRDRDKEEIVQVMQILAQIPDVNVFPLMRQLLSKFEWADVNTYLPLGQGGALLTLDDFQQQQSQAISGGGGALGQQAQTNLQPLAAAFGVA